MFLLLFQKKIFLLSSSVTFGCACRLSLTLSILFVGISRQSQSPQKSISLYRLSLISRCPLTWNNSIHIPFFVFFTKKKLYPTGMWISPRLDLENCSLTFNQAFGYAFSSSCIIQRIQATLVNPPCFFT